VTEHLHPGETVALLGMGANLGDRMGQIRRAVRAIAAAPGIRLLGCSAPYESDPVGFIDQPRFINAVIAVATLHPPEEMLRITRSVEGEMGRRRSFRNAPRHLDIDLLFYEDFVCEGPELTLPHPRYGDRSFVVVPTLELLESLRLPGAYWKRLHRELVDNPARSGLDRIPGDLAEESEM